MATRVAGTLILIIDGETYTVGEGSFEVNVNGRKREMVPGTSHYKETQTPTSVKGQVVTVPGFDSQALANAADVTVQVQAANGNTYGLRSAVFTGDPVVNVTDGTMAVEFSAGPDAGFEITA